MEGSAAGGRIGGHGGANGGRGKSKKARARAKASAAAAAAASAAKQSGAKKAAAAAAGGATAATSGRPKALKAVKAGKAAANAGSATASAPAGVAVARLTRKKLAGTKSAAKLKMGTVAAAAAVAAAPPSASTVPKKGSVAKKQQHHEAAVAPTAPVGASAHALSTAERSIGGPVEVVAKSTVVSLTGGKRTRGKKRRAGSIGASDHESSGTAASPETAAPTPTMAPTSVAQEVPSHLPQSHHIVDLNKHSPSGETPTRIAFLGGSAVRESARQDTSTGSIEHIGELQASTPHSASPKTAPSPTARPVATKKLKVAKKGSARAKAVSNASGASDALVTKALTAPKAQVTPKAQAATKATATTKAGARAEQMQSRVAKNAAPPTPAIAATSEGASASSVTPAPQNGVIRSPRWGNGAASKHELNAASDDVSGAAAALASEGDDEASWAQGVLTVSASPSNVTIQATSSQPPQEQLPQNNADHQVGSALQETHARTVSISLKAAVPLMSARSTMPKPVERAVPSEPLQLLGAASSSNDRGNIQNTEKIKATKTVSPLAPPEPVFQAKKSEEQIEVPSHISSEPTPAHHEYPVHEGRSDAVQQQSQYDIGVMDSTSTQEIPSPSISSAPVVSELPERDTPAPSAPAVTTTTKAPSPPRVKIPEPSNSDKESLEDECDGDGVTSPATLAVRRIFSGELKRLQAVHFQSLSAASEHPAGDGKATATTSKKRRREDDSGHGETPQRQATSTHHPTITPAAPTLNKETENLGIIMDSHAYVARVMRSDPVVESTPAVEKPEHQQAPVALPPNTWGASFGFSGAAAVSAPPVPSSPRSPLASTRPLSSWFLSKGAANFVKRVSFKRDSGGFRSNRSSKRQHSSIAAEANIASDSGSRGAGENRFLESLTSHAAWRSWYTSDGNKPVDSLLDPIPTRRLPRELLDHPVGPMALEDDGGPFESSHTNAAGASGTTGVTTTAAPGRASALERLEQEIRAEKRRARAFERMLLLALQGKAASGREFEDEYGPVLGHART